MSFNIDAYKAQCRTIAKSFKALLAARFAQSQFVQYEKTLAENDMVPQQAVNKIEREIILKGKSFRPIDAYQF